MSKPSLEKKLRRQLRKRKKNDKNLFDRMLKQFKLEQFFGKSKSRKQLKRDRYMPKKVPGDTQHIRVVRQRLMSGRIKPSETRKTRDTNAEGSSSKR